MLVRQAGPVLFLYNKFKKFILLQERRPSSMAAAVIFVTFVGIVRGLLEGMLYDPGAYTVPIILAYVPFYLAMYLGVVLVLNLATGVRKRKIYRVALVGLFLGIFPPVLDLLFNWGRNEHLRYGYFLKLFSHGEWYNRFFIFYEPESRLPLGEAMTLWLLLIFGTVYAHIKTCSYFKTLVAFSGIYLVIFFNAYILPSGLYALLHSSAPTEALQHWRINTFDYYISYSQLVFVIIIYTTSRKDFFLALVKRANHLVPFVVICMIGARVDHQLVFEDIQVSSIVAICFLTALLHNDYFDRFDDRSRKSYTGSDDISIFNFVASYLVLLLLAHGKISGLPIALLLLLSFLYSYPFYRAKKYFPANMKIEGIWGGASFLSGMTVMGNVQFSTEKLWYLFFVFGGWSFVSTLKDAKDFKEDYRAKNRSVFILFKNKYSFSRTYLFALRLVLVLFLVPVFWAYSSEKYMVTALLSLNTAVIWLWCGRFLNSSRYEGLLALTSLYLIILYFAI